MTRRIALLAWLVVQSGCTWIGGGGPAPVPLQGRYEGTLHIEARDIPAELSVRGRGSGLLMELSTQEGLRAEGSGSLRGTALHAGLDYDHACSGRMVLSGHGSEDGSSVSGSIQVADCTGRVTGSFTFTRVGSSRVDALLPRL